MMQTIPEMLSTVMKDHANRTAIVDGEVVLSYAELEQRIAALAMTLHHLKVQEGDRVALLLPNGVDFVTSYFAVVTLGAIVVPLNDHYQQTELLYFLQESGVSLLITSQPFAQLCYQVLAQCASPCLLFLVEEQRKPSGTARMSLEDFQIPVGADAPVMYQFSSGSTGRPKRIARTHANILFELQSFRHTLQITSEDRFLGVAPFSHVNGLMRSMMASLSAGATLYPLPKFERQTVVEVIQKHHISVFIAVPFMFSILAKTNFRQPPDLSSLRLCVSASAPMPPKLNQQFFQHFGRHVRQLYGSTETGTISVNLCPDVEYSLESVGTPLQGVEVAVFTEEGYLALPEEMGEIAVKSPAAITGYDGLPEVNREVFRDGYFFTGDLGKQDKEGLLYLIGRKKFFINKGGYKINPHELEELLESHPMVEEAVVVGVPTAYGDERVKAVIVLKAPCKEAELIEYCRGKIADFKIPSMVEFREGLPKSPTGKIRRKMLLET